MGRKKASTQAEPKSSSTTSKSTSLEIFGEIKKNTGDVSENGDENGKTCNPSGQITEVTIRIPVSLQGEMPPNVGARKLENMHTRFTTSRVREAHWRLRRALETLARGSGFREVTISDTTRYVFERIADELEKLSEK